MSEWDLNKYATYPGDVRHITDFAEEGPKGPAEDFAGTFYRAVDAEYDPVEDKTRVTFKVLGDVRSLTSAS